MEFKRKERGATISNNVSVVSCFQLKRADRIDLLLFLTYTSEPGLSYMHSVQSLFAVRQMIYTAKGHTSVLNDLRNPNILVYIIQRFFLEYIFHNSEKCA